MGEIGFLTLSKAGFFETAEISATAIVQPLEQDAKTPSRLREGVALT